MQCCIIVKLYSLKLKIIVTAAFLENIPTNIPSITIIHKKISIIKAINKQDLKIFHDILGHVIIIAHYFTRQ